MRQFGQFRADVTVMLPGVANRLAIVEIKILDEGRLWDGIRADHSRIRKFQGLLRENGSPVIVDGYVGGLICDLATGMTAEETIEYVHAQLADVSTVPGVRTAAVGGGWGWCFFCARMADLP